MYVSSIDRGVLLASNLSGEPMRQCDPRLIGAITSLANATHGSLSFFNHCRRTSPDFVSRRGRVLLFRAAVLTEHFH